MSVSFTTILPEVGSISFINNFINVDLPAPLAPTRNTNSPLSIERFILDKATTSFP